MNKIILATLALNSIVFANIFEWKSDLHTKKYSNPMQEISKKIEQDINYFIIKNSRTPLNIVDAIPPHIVKPIIPARIKEPTLPSSIKLTKGEFEKTVEFEFRVKKASRQRDLELKKLQENYRFDVEKRNQKIELLSQQYNEDIARRNQIIQNIQMKKISLKM